MGSSEQDGGWAVVSRTGGRQFVLVTGYLLLGAQALCFVCLSLVGGMLLGVSNDNNNSLYYGKLYICLYYGKLYISLYYGKLYI